MTTKKENPKPSGKKEKTGDYYTETRHVVIYGYTRQELKKVIRHFEAQLPDFVKITIDNTHLVTNITLTGMNTGVELLRFQMNRYHSNLNRIFTPDVVSLEDQTVAEVLGNLLHERELTVACAESCTGGNIAHRITQIPGSSAYFLGSVVSYSNDVKANVLKVPRSDISSYGAVSKEVVEAMAKGVATLMRSDCAIATSGIAGPDGGTPLKPVGTVWIAVKYGEQIVSECLHFSGDRNAVIESATNHGMVMLINLLRNSYVMQEEVNDD
ncbi:MAG: CinA family protein [Muribaculaceae bacterium]|nr:CinA family protein [Muribaculaceae bacterium]